MSKHKKKKTEKTDNESKNQKKVRVEKHEYVSTMYFALKKAGLIK